MVVQPVWLTFMKVKGKTQLPQELLPEDTVVVVVMDEVVPDPDPDPELDSQVQGSGVPVNGPQVFISGPI